MDFSTREAFTVREFCARYGICRQTFYDEIKRGRIKARKLGKKTVILRADADAWAASLPELRAVVRSRRAHEPCPAPMLWAPLPRPAVAPNDVLRLASASTVQSAHGNRRLAALAWPPLRRARARGRLRHRALVAP
jgi:excisionase family DNA binding protein